MNGLVGWGLLLSGAFASGMIVTVAVLPSLAVLLRLRSFRILAPAEPIFQRTRHWVEAAAAIAIIALGLWPLLPR